MRWQNCRRIPGRRDSRLYMNLTWIGDRGRGQLLLNVAKWISLSAEFIGNYRCRRCHDSAVLDVDG
ncbi:hypothetical protein IE4872_PD00060 (plasmid) [Rhizobium gallicum]|uniref:Uncharacterized protein n=1 Tax=Rhizobium gallicum TaxID=56730 RepID=A0A1L5NRS1_9HYPH|nr:hypothetical protein IE4872_PD00060 [Rhizobium gallicum]